MYKIIVDSCGELPEELKQDLRFQTVSLEMEVGEKRIRDDATFDQKAFLKLVKECPTAPKSSCPSPEEYMESYHCDAEHVYAVTLSAELSGSYNSAELAKNLYKEQYGEKQIYIFNSRSASVGETLIALKVQECEEAEMTFEQVIETVEAYIAQMHTMFVLETLETLRKNGRLSNLKAFVANALNIKPVMASTDEGTICQLGQSRGMNKALKKMVEELLKVTPKTEERILAISHCNCPQRAQMVKEEIEKKAKFKDVIVLDTAGISSMYANDGGVIMVV